MRPGRQSGSNSSGLSNPRPMQPLLLNLSLRKIARTGTNVQSAIAASQSGAS